MAPKVRQTIGKPKMDRRHIAYMVRVMHVDGGYEDFQETQTLTDAIFYKGLAEMFAEPGETVKILRKVVDELELETRTAGISNSSSGA